MKLILVLLLALIGVVGVLSECPKVDDVPVMHVGGQFTCERCYRGPGADTEQAACNDCGEERT